MMDEPTVTKGKSKSPERIIHHTFWYYKRMKRANMFEKIYCEECSTSFPSSSSFRLVHPSDEYLIVKTIKHIAGRRKK